MRATRAMIRHRQDTVNGKDGQKMKKLFLVLALAFCAMPRTHGSPPTLSAFSAKWTPFQVQVPVLPLVVPVSLFCTDTPVYGIDLTLVGSQKKTCGLSCGLLSNHGDHYGFGIAFVKGGGNNYGLMSSLVNVFNGSGGVAVGLLNFNYEGDEPLAKPDSILQIGFFNYAQNGLQIGLLNHNPNALIPWMVLFNYSPRGKSAPASDDRQKGKHAPGKQNKDQQK